MNTKRQKQIRAFLVKEFGESRGSKLFDMQAETLRALIQRQQGKSKSQMKTLSGTILPTVALYKALQQSGLSQADAYACARRYVLDVVAAQNHVSTARMERIPGFYALYSSVFLKIVRTVDLWQSEQRRDRNSFDVTIRKCLWHTTCAENGCPELCRLFCESDNVNYGGLKKLGFTRTQTLGCGGNCCDFHFYRK